MATIFTSSACSGHQVPAGFPECQQRLDGVLERLARTDWPVRTVDSHPESGTVVEAVHDPAYVERLRRASASDAGWLDSGDNPISPGTWEATWGAIDAGLHAVDWALAGESRVGFVAVRPPGHHAERATAMGFCYFNNVAVAAEHALKSHGLRRVAIVDIDVHHGNGTQHLFEEREDVLYASIHQWPFYPGTGASEESGVGAGLGATLNVPLPAGSGDGAYRAALERTIVPALRHFLPELLFVSAGFDAWRGDPLAGMLVSRKAFTEWGRLLGALAAATCRGRVVATLEGGYDLRALPELVVNHLEGLDQAVETGRAHDRAGRPTRGA